VVKRNSEEDAGKLAAEFDEYEVSFISVQTLYAIMS
jgi:hypothetical protein